MIDYFKIIFILKFIYLKRLISILHSLFKSMNFFNDLVYFLLVSVTCLMVVHVKRLRAG